MTSPISMLTAFVLLLHALVGCGTHLHHASPWCNNSAPAIATTVDCCDHDHDAPDLPSLPCRCHFVCHHSCISLPPQKLQWDDAVSTLVVAFLFADSPDIGYPSFLNAIRTAATSRFAAAPPLAIHLLHQSLLI